MPYFSGLMQQTGITLPPANQPDAAAQPAAPQPEPVPPPEVEEVREVGSTGQAGTLAGVDLSVAPQAIQPPSPDVPQPIPPGLRAVAEPEIVVYESTVTPLAAPTPAPVREAAIIHKQPTALPSRDAEAPVIEVIETVELAQDAPAPAPEAPPRSMPRPRAEQAQATSAPPSGDAATRLAKPSQPQTLAQSLAEVRAWVTATPEAFVPEPTPGVRTPVVEIEQAVAAPRRDVPLPAHRSREPSALAEVGQHFSLHIGTIQLSIEVPPQPPVNVTHPPPAGPQLTPAPASQASRWRRRYVRL